MTGASGNIGRALVQRFVQEGCFVFAADIANLDVFKSDGPKVLALKLDLSSDASIKELEKHVTEEYDGLDILSMAPYRLLRRSERQ